MDEILEKLLKNSFRAGMFLANPDADALPDIICDIAWERWRTQMLESAPDINKVRIYREG